MLGTEVIAGFFHLLNQTVIGKPSVLKLVILWGDNVRKKSIKLRTQSLNLLYIKILLQCSFQMIH
jgi:hypothetical protein